VNFRPIGLLRFGSWRTLEGYPENGMAQFEKFDELLIYIAERSADDPKFGDLKLNKLLYYADIAAYRERGATITGSRYQHLRHGPGSRSLWPARKKLQEEGAVEIKPRRFYEFWQRVTRAKRPARREVFEPGELEIVNRVLERYRNFNGSEMADISHDEPGWKMTTEGEDIPLETALLAQRSSRAAIRQGRTLAERFNW
jgi:uncharacterized phage-associated protein